MDNEFLRSRLASIQLELETQITGIEGEVAGVFEEQPIENLRESWRNINRRVNELDKLVTLLHETQEWLK